MTTKRELSSAKNAERISKRRLLQKHPRPPPAQKVVVQVQEEKKRRLNPLWLILLLLLLVTCCCLLLLFEQVEVPDFAAPYIDPFIENVREALPAFIGGGGNGKGGQLKNGGIDCADFRDQLQEVDLGEDTACDDNECFTDIHDLDNFEDIEVSYSWDGEDRRRATCEDRGTFLRCYFPRDQQADRVEAWISIDECSEEELGYSDGWLDEEEVEVPVAEEIVECCEIVDVTKVRMEITNKFILKFDVECSDPWPVSSGGCIPGKTYVGADQDIFWADVDCCLDDSADDLLHCESGHVDQKVSWTKVELSDGECTWESPKFFTPAYQPDKRFPASDDDSSSGSGCPSGESMCAGSCCSIGHCCDCGSGTGCWSDCSGCS